MADKDPGLRWAIATVGVSGAFITLGFLIDVAYQDFLGYEIRHIGGATEYLTQIGQFFVDVFNALLEWATNHHWKFLIGIVLGLAGVMLLRGHQPSQDAPSKNLTWHAVLIGVLLFSGTCAEFSLLDLPPLRLRGLLLTNIAALASPVTPGRTSARTRELVRDHVCSRVTESLLQSENVKAFDCTLAREEYKERLVSTYLKNLLLSTLLIAALAWVIKWAVTHEIHTVIIGILAGGLIVLQLVGLMFSYSKLLKSTELNEVILLISSNPNPTRARAEALTRTVPAPGDNISPDTDLFEEHGYLLSRSSSEVGIYHKSEHQIWLIPWSEIKLLKVERKGDVLHFYIANSLQRASEQSPAP